MACCCPPVDGTHRSKRGALEIRAPWDDLVTRRPRRQAACVGPGTDLKLTAVHVRRNPAAAKIHAAVKTSTSPRNRRRPRSLLSKLTKSLQMPLDCFADIALRLFQRCARCNTAGQVGYICRPVFRRFLKNDRVSDTHGCFSRPAALWMTSAFPPARRRPGALGWSQPEV